MTPEARAKLQFTVQGLINQFGFFLLLSSSKNIALSFGEKNLVSAILLAANIASVSILFINAIFLMHISSRYRLIANAIIMFLGYAILIGGIFTSFYLIILGALFTGTASAFGQVIHYGFIKSLPAEFVGPFSSGTGICGFTGAFIYMFLSAIHVQDYIIFCVMLPIVVFYLLNFLNLHSLVVRNSYFKNPKGMELLAQNEDQVNGVEASHSFSGIEEQEITIEEDQGLWEAYKMDPLNHIFIFILYFCEYTIVTGFFDRLSQMRTVEDDGFLEKNLFTVNQFLYQFGVLIARSSLYCIKSKATGLMTMNIFFLFLIFFYFCLFYVNVSKFIILILALILGLVGGWGYVFSYYRIMDNRKITKKNREKLINYLAVCADFGSFLATGFATILSNTILKVD